MKHALLLMVGLMALGLAVGASAQSGSGAKDQAGSPAASPSTTPAAGGDSAAQPAPNPGDTGAAPAQPAAPSDPATPSHPAAASPTTHEKLPATGSMAPYLLGFGLAAIGAFALTLLFRRPRAARP